MIVNGNGYDGGGEGGYMDSAWGGMVSRFAKLRHRCDVWDRALNCVGSWHNRSMACSRLHIWYCIVHARDTWYTRLGPRQSYDQKISGCGNMNRRRNVSKTELRCVPSALFLKTRVDALYDRS